MLTSQLIPLKKRKKSQDKNIYSYLDKIINAELHYDCIIDDIFLTLGGCTFAEKAEREIKDGAMNVVTGYRGEIKYALKKGKISFDILSSYKDSIWNEYRVSLDGDGYKALLRALTYFDSNKVYTSIYGDWYRNFVSYNKNEKDGIYGDHPLCKTKINNFKYFKNGKFEVTFDS